MKRMILSLVVLFAALSGRAAEEPQTTESSEWLPQFTSVVVEAPADIVLVKAPDTEAPRITYDTKGSTTSKFRAEVRDKVLYIKERTVSARTERTTVKLTYNDLQSLKLTDATATLDGTLTATTFDLSVGEGARLTAAIDIKDLHLDISGHSEATLTGEVRYLTLMITTGKLDAGALACTSVQANAQSKGSAALNVGERIEAKASTGASVRYKGNPSIVRTSKGLVAGEIKHVE